MSLIIQKFGGSSLATPEAIQHAADKVAQSRSLGNQLVVVVSAMGKTTDELISLAHQTVSSPSQRELDMLLTVGERISMSLLAMALEELGIPAISLTGSQCGIVTSSTHTDARILEVKGDRIRKALSEGRVVIVAGFQGVSRENEITTLGRGGSDTTAVALAAALKANCCEVYTDVEGLYTADPNRVKSAKLLPSCSYETAIEMAALGAKMHPRSIELAQQYHIPIHMGATHSSRFPGTIISKQSVTKENTSMEQTKVVGITTQDGFEFMDVQVPLDKLLGHLYENQVCLRFFTACDESVKLVLAKEKANLIKSGIENAEVKVSESEQVGVVSLVGEGLNASFDILPRFHKVLKELKLSSALITTSSQSICAAVASHSLSDVAGALHDEFISVN